MKVNIFFKDEEQRCFQGITSCEICGYVLILSRVEDKVTTCLPFMLEDIDYWELDQNV